MNLLLDTAATTTTGLGNYTSLLLMVGMFVVVYLLFMLPQKKRDKQIQEMRSNLDIGDEVLTRGGIIGRVVSVKDDTVLIETGSDRTRIRISKFAVEANNTALEREQAARASAKAEAQAKKDAKKAGK